MELVYGPILCGSELERVYRREDGEYFLSYQEVVPNGKVDGKTQKVLVGEERMEEVPIMAIFVAAGLRRLGAPFEDYKRVFRSETESLFYYHFGPAAEYPARLESCRIYTATPTGFDTFTVMAKVALFTSEE